MRIRLSNFVQFKKRMLWKRPALLLFGVIGGVAVAVLGVHQLFFAQHRGSPSSSPHSATTQDQAKIDAWIYPDAPGALTALQDGRKITAAKIEFLHIEDTGAVTQINQSQEAPNGYSAATVALVKQHSAEQYITVSGTMAGTTLAMRSSQTIPQIVQLANQTGFGVELDWEEFGQWNAEYYGSYKTFVTKLAAALHASGHKLLIDGPPIPDASSQKWYKWKYEELAALTDGVVMMIYDNQYDAGVGTPIAPENWSLLCMQWLKRTAGEKGIAGIAAYGYKGDSGSGKIAVVPSATIKRQIGAVQPTRTKDGELTVKEGNTFYDYADQQTMRIRLQQAKASGVQHLSVWSLGDNPWF